MTNQLKVLCVDDHAFLVEGLRARFALERDLECIGHLPSAQNLVQEVQRRQPDMVLMDIEMPGPDPFEAIGDLHKRCPEVRVLLLSAYVRDHYLEAAVAAGAWGYLSKGDNPDDIVEGLRKVSRGEFAMSPEVEERCGLPQARRGASTVAGKPAAKIKSLTPRELQILRMIGRGMSRAHIATVLHRSRKTVDAHQASIMEKLGIHDRVELVRYTIREGLVEP
jgi:DNA-binding NarL/FixJ family response regulator